MVIKVIRFDTKDIEKRLGSFDAQNCYGCKQRWSVMNISKAVLLISKLQNVQVMSTCMMVGQV